MFMFQALDSFRPLSVREFPLFVQSSRITFHKPSNSEPFAPAQKSNKKNQKSLLISFLKIVNFCNYSLTFCMISPTSLSNSVLLFALFSTLRSTVSATPRGAPKCGINGTAIQAGMGTPSDPSLGYFLDVKPAGNNNWNITIQNKAGNRYFGL